MTRRLLRPRLEDILENIRIVEGMVKAHTLETFASNDVPRLAVERAIEIISEATRHIPNELRAEFSDVPWRNIIAIGNKLRHEYQRVDVDIVWNIAEEHLPALRPVIEAIASKSE